MFRIFLRLNDSLKKTIKQFQISTANVKEKMKPYCRAMSDQAWASKSAMELINDEDCPAWVLPSSAVLGRCLPGLVAESSAASENKTVFNSDETQNHETISNKQINNAVTALGAFLRSTNEKMF